MKLPLVPVDAGPDGGFFAVDAGFEGKGAVEPPLGGGDAVDDQFFAVADGAEVIAEVLEEAEEGRGILAFEDEVFVAGEAVGEAVAAGGGFAFGGARAGGLSGRCGGWLPPAVGKVSDRDGFSSICGRGYGPSFRLQGSWEDLG